MKIIPIFLSMVVHRALLHAFIPESVIIEPASSSVLQIGGSGGSGQSDEQVWSVLVMLPGVEAILN